MRHYSLAAALAVSCMASPGQAATGLECIDSSYTAAEQAIFAAFRKNHAISDDQGPGALSAIMPTIGARANACADLHDWNEAAFRQALYYKTAMMIDEALTAQSSLNQRQMSKLSQLIVDPKSKLRSLMLPTIEAEFRGEEPQRPSADMEAELENEMDAAGLPTDEKTSRFIGALVGARLMREIGKANFLKL